MLVPSDEFVGLELSHCYLVVLAVTGLHWTPTVQHEVAVELGCPRARNLALLRIVNPLVFGLVCTGTLSVRVPQVCHAVDEACIVVGGVEGQAAF